MKIAELINMHYYELNENERYLCQYFYEHKKEFITNSIDNLAKKCGVSKTLIVRFSKHLGLSGFREFKARLRLESREIETTNNNLMQTMLESYYKMIDDFQKKDYIRIFEALYYSNQVIVYGESSSQARVASEMKRIFLSEKPFIDLHGRDMCQAIEKNTCKGDVVFLLSLSGETDYVLELARNLQIKGIFLVSVTRMSNNTLASYCTENLYIESVHMKIGSYGNYESATPYFILIELLYLAYQNYLANKK